MKFFVLPLKNCYYFSYITYSNFTIVLANFSSIHLNYICLPTNSLNPVILYLLPPLTNFYYFICAIYL